MSASSSKRAFRIAPRALLRGFVAGLAGALLVACAKREEPVTASAPATGDVALAGPGTAGSGTVEQAPAMERVARVYGNTYLMRHFDEATGFLCYGYDTAGSAPSCTKVAPARAIPVGNRD